MPKCKPEFYKCPICGQPLQKIKGRVVYANFKNRSLDDLPIWACNNNHEMVYIGCHKGTDIPLGYAAGKTHRQARTAAHKALDCLWQGAAAHMTRKQAYAWLAERMGIDVNDCHIGWFDIAQCNAVVKHVSNYWANYKAG